MGGMIDLSWKAEKLFVNLKLTCLDVRWPTDNVQTLKCSANFQYSKLCSVL